MPSDSDNVVLSALSDAIDILSTQIACLSDSISFAFSDSSLLDLLARAGNVSADNREFLSSIKSFFSSLNSPQTSPTALTPTPVLSPVPVQNPSYLHIPVSAPLSAPFTPDSPSLSNSLAALLSDLVPHPAPLSAYDVATIAKKSVGFTGIFVSLDSALDAVSQTFKSRLDLAASNITLLNTLGDSTAEQSAVQDYLNILVDKLFSLINLDAFVKSEQDFNILETAKNKILTEIAKTAASIDDSVNSFSGSFGLPSDFSPLSEYQYFTDNSDNIISSRVVSIGDVTFLMQFDKLEDKTAAEVNQSLDRFAQEIIRRMSGNDF